MAAPKSRDDDKPTVPKFAFELRDDGNVKTESLRESSKDKARKFLPQLADDLGLKVVSKTEPEKPDPDLEAVAGFTTGAFLHVIGMLETAIVSRWSGAPLPVLMQVCPLSPEEQKAISGPLARVLAKYGSTMLQKYGDETALAVIVGSIVWNKVQAAQALMATIKPTPTPPASPAPPAEPDKIAA